MMFEPIRPAETAFDADGTLRSPAYDDVYASSHGAFAQARHVFLAGNGLPARWRAGGRFTVVETGFGTGTNFLATWQAWREAAPPRARLHYVSVEKHPFPRAALARVLSREAQVAALSAPLLESYPPLLPGFHRLHFDGGRVALTLLFGDCEAMLRELDAHADAIYLDGFAPAKNPQMWSEAVFAQLARLAVAGTTLATYTVAASVCRGLEAAGFAPEKRPGFASKREMLCGRFERGTGPAASAPRSAVVIGAGLAGTSIAHRLAQRGWGVRVIERHGAPAQEASGNPAGLVRPVLSPDWNAHSRFTCAAFLYAQRHDASLRASGSGAVRGEGGVLQFARDAARFDRQGRLVADFGLPPELVQILTQAQAQELAGVRVAGPASWFPAAFWASPASMCAANVEAAGAAVESSYGIEVAGLRRDGQAWAALDAAGQVVARAPVVVLANAWAAARLPQAAGLPLRPVRGQVSLMRERAKHGLRLAVCGDGYATPAVGGMHCFGASFNEGMQEAGLRAEDHAANLRRLEAMLPGFGDGVDVQSLQGRVAFRAMSRDRLPVLGELGCPQERQDAEGLFACLGLASRGMTWAALAAEIVASRIAGEPLPVEASLLRALAPARFARERPVNGG